MPFIHPLILIYIFLLGFAEKLENGGAEFLPIFHIGSRKLVIIRQSFIRKASVVLEAEDMNKGKSVAPLLFVPYL